MLKYLFIASFADGSFLEQTQADKPTWAMREDGSGSAFTDVLNPKSPLTSFTLVGDNREYGVDLTTLNFSVACGEYVSEFRLFTLDDLPDGKLYDTKIYFLRTGSADLDIIATVQSDLSLKTETLAKQPKILHYRLGLAGRNLAGEEITKFIEFD